MQVGEYIDGRALSYDPLSLEFAVGGIQVSLAQVREDDARGDISWLSGDSRSWLADLYEWTESQGDSTRSSAIGPTDVELAVDKALEAASARFAADTRARDRKAAAALRRAGRAGGFNWLEAPSAYGRRNAAMVCPHCQVRGQVRVKAVTQKRGISGSKATAAVLTAGVSMLATGLSRKERVTQAHCDNCGNTWSF